MLAIYEKHSISGGLCTSWTRKGYTFEGALHWLTGTNPDAPLYRLWRETGILADNVNIYRDDPFLVHSENGEKICLYRDIEKLKDHFLAISPKDSKMIDKFCQDIKAFINFNMPVMDIKGVKVKQKSKKINY
jgi:phytoene dehydrogenase-like protein